MFGAFSRWVQGRQGLAELYAALATQARRPIFYTKLGVPDTVDAASTCWCCTPGW